MKKAEKRVGGAYEKSTQAQFLSIVPVVGPLLSPAIAWEIGDKDRLHSAKRLSWFAGPVPSTSRWGGSANHGKVTRQDYAWLR